MSEVISLHDDLARRLRAEAESRGLSVQQFAVSILDRAAPAPDDGADWGAQNRRRLELLRKSACGNLSTNEARELAELQNRLDERFDSFDIGLLAWVRAMTHEVESLGNKSTNG
jgi:hypothetical protein